MAAEAVERKLGYETHSSEKKYAREEVAEGQGNSELSSSLTCLRLGLEK